MVTLKYTINNFLLQKSQKEKNTMNNLNNPYIFRTRKNRSIAWLGCGLLCSSLLMVGCTTTGKGGKQPAVRDASSNAAEISALGVDGELQNTPFTDSQGRPIKSYRDKNGILHYVDADGRPVTIDKNGRVTYGEPGLVAYSGGGFETKVIYFDYDSSEVKADSQSVVTAHADYLLAHPGTQVTLKGHTDERGSREYNIGLGERRAKAVEQLLILKGVPSRQVETVSLGEEQPAEFGHDESAWSLNRRVELTYPAGTE